MTASKTVLIVDDDADIQDNLGIFLESEGYVPEHARNGQEALDYLSSRSRPCTVLLDLMMPTLSGYELLERLQGSQPAFDVPIIIFSAAADAQQVARKWGLRLLPKPFSLDSLSRMLAETCPG